MEWFKRPYLADDEDFVVFAWLKSYAHSRAAKAQGAARDSSPAELDYWERHRPLIEMLLRDACTEVICDPERVGYAPGKPAVIWAYACTSGDTVHSVVVKRQVVNVMGKDFAGALVRDLLGERLTRPCGYTGTIRELVRGDWGVRLPTDEWNRPIWRVDPTWLGCHALRARAA